MKHIKTYTLFERVSKETKLFESLSPDDEKENYILDILSQLEAEGLQIESSRTRKDVPGKFHSDIFLEIYIRRPYGSPDRVIPGVPQPPGGKYPGNLFFWYEVKWALFHLVEWYFAVTQYEPIDKKTEWRWEKDDSPFRYFNSGIEFAIGCHKEEDFKGIGDFISFSNLRLQIKL